MLKVELSSRFLSYVISERSMNASDRYEHFVVPEGRKKDTKFINATSFAIEGEYHTIGNIVHMQLHRDENVLFAGYELHHLLQYKIIVRVSILGTSLILVDLKKYVVLSHKHFQLLLTIWLLK
uniref:DNA-directed RNA polymerase RBP11-like dimerisation domain-containing protein n=1 Tax=Lactuca sativa TaxID=4236 RepID=A0A9R1WWC2_LACSA|nr:hypothetical protein LSAT_V11C900478100 [Lactuca sativa]